MHGLRVIWDQGVAVCVDQHSVEFAHVMTDCSVVVEPFAGITNSESVLRQRLVIRRCNALNNEHDSVAAVKR